MFYLFNGAKCGPAVLITIGERDGFEQTGQPMVPRAGLAPWRENAQDDHRRPGAQAPRRSVQYTTVGVVIEGAVMKAVPATI
jgi:hypothetical protein